mmetsp:Transcript_8580/g.14774  ORF Transcript_8580/g.14774 Transcript_8580/m.14774 type:complete len:275 (-) Transcript_8580:974-1798(-)
MKGSTIPLGCPSGLLWDRGNQDRPCWKALGENSRRAHNALPSRYAQCWAGRPSRPAAALAASASGDVISMTLCASFSPNMTIASWRPARPLALNTSNACMRRARAASGPTWSTSLENDELGLHNRRTGESNSATLPASITRMRSDSMIVSSRCAIVRIVDRANSSLITFWIMLSVSKSMAAVASSRHRMRELFRMALARQNNCLCPREKLAPESSTIVSNWSGSLAMLSFRWAFSSDRHSSSSDFSPKGSRFDLTVPLNMTGSCGRMANAPRTS